ncbi:MAG TPA: hypothetical protein VKS21_13440, partial [Spirochaetota bacterium]|nr:hypothetical protein [Spirochaetota bacterium]
NYTNGFTGRFYLSNTSFYLDFTPPRPLPCMESNIINVLYFDSQDYLDAGRTNSTNFSFQTAFPVSKQPVLACSVVIEQDKTVVGVEPVSGGEVTVKIYTIDGVRLYKETRAVSGGSQVFFNWYLTTPVGARAANGYYIVKVVGQGIQKILPFVLRK